VNIANLVDQRLTFDALQRFADMKRLLTNKDVELMDARAIHCKHAHITCLPCNIYLHAKRLLNSETARGVGSCMGNGNIRNT
jgi:hypothetical protein